jgi:sulfite exporter TauE/SafE
MPGELSLLLLTTVSIAALHTVSGPDHYMPFIALSRARNWSRQRTLFWVLLCGCGHVWSSVLLALAGAAIGWSLPSVRWLEGVRGSLAGWAMLVFGLLFFAWSLLRLRRNNLHRHFTVYDDELYVYEHSDSGSAAPQRQHRVTPWVLFLIFILGPCEPMIPLLYLPAAQASWWHMVTLIVAYTGVTLVTMMMVVLFLRRGLQLAQSRWLERYQHLLSGGAIAACGAAMLFLGW